MLILEVLARQLDIALAEFTKRCTFNSESGDHLRLTKKTPHKSDTNAIGLASHTDFGSVTILFNWLGGLQIQSRDPSNEGEWAFVKPLAGHAIINLGDAMVKFTNGALKSAKHRVVPSPGDQAKVDRYSIVYFVRPADDALLTPLEEFRANHVIQVGGKIGEEKVYTAGEWVQRRGHQMADM
jgi:isopenicillin N synthase-like dioxygenase